MEFTGERRYSGRKPKGGMAALALKEAGKAKSDREAARKIAADTGETDGSVRVKIQRGRHEVAQGVPLIQPKSNPISNPVLTNLEKLC